MSGFGFRAMEWTSSGSRAISRGTIVRRVAHAASRPRTPPPTESSRLSVSNWRSSRQRDAPTARRTAISFLPAHGAGQQKVGEIGAGDHQHQADGGQDHRAHAQHGTAPFRIVHEGCGVHQKRSLAAGVLAIHTGGDYREVGAGGGKGDAGLQAAGHFEPAHVGVGEVIPALVPLLVYGERRPDVRADDARAAEAFGRDTHDGVAAAIEHDGLAEDLGIGREVALPERDNSAPRPERSLGRRTPTGAIRALFAGLAPAGRK